MATRRLPSLQSAPAQCQSSSSRLLGRGYRGLTVALVGDLTVDPQPRVPLRVQHQPSHRPMPGLQRQRILPRLPVGSPLLVESSRPKLSRVRHVPPRGRLLAQRRKLGDGGVVQLPAGKVGLRASAQSWGRFPVQCVRSVQPTAGGCRLDSNRLQRDADRSPIVPTQRNRFRVTLHQARQARP